MKKRGYSRKGFWGQINRYDTDGNKIGESWRSFWGGQNHFDADGNLTGHTLRNFWGGVNHYDKDWNKISHSHRAFFGGYNTYSTDGTKIGHSHRAFLGREGLNHYEVEGAPTRTRKSGTDYTGSGSFVNYGNGVLRVEPSFTGSYEHSEFDGTDIWGIEEVKGKNVAQIQKILAGKYQQADCIYNQVAIESGFREELFDDTQMIKDFWLYTVCDQLEGAIMTHEEKIDVAQQILECIGAENETSTALHYKWMSSDRLYRRYMEHCFSCKDKESAFFWVYMLHMGSTKEENRDYMIEKHVQDSMKFTRIYTKFLVQLEIYLNQVYPLTGFKGRIKDIVLKRLTVIFHALEKEGIGEADLRDFLNPKYFEWTD